LKKNKTGEPNMSIKNISFTTFTGRSVEIKLNNASPYEWLIHLFTIIFAGAKLEFPTENFVGEELQPLFEDIKTLDAYLCQIDLVTPKERYHYYHQFLSGNQCSKKFALLIDLIFRGFICEKALAKTFYEAGFCQNISLEKRLTELLLDFTTTTSEGFGQLMFSPKTSNYINYTMDKFSKGHFLLN